MAAFFSICKIEGYRFIKNRQGGEEILIIKGLPVRILERSSLHVGLPFIVIWLMAVFAVLMVTSYTR